MRFVKLFFISVIILFFVLTMLSALFPAKIRMSRAIDIQASREKVLNLVGDLKAWELWNQFVTTAPLTNRVFSTPSAGTGAYLSSDQLKITCITSRPDSIVTTWNQLNAKRFTGGYNLLELRPGTITVQWYFDFRFKWYPWDKLSSLLYERQLGPVMEESLAKLKATAESPGN